ncbi:MAG: hypothetical protein HN521_17100 [Candidatus Latescibacteria bacterium]|nr:hypothetical protein [Candidatus Latescibacterota bacterium]MBT5828754.1 hypothetical protein [Candidatus Latescibacterota bacterium]
MAKCKRQKAKGGCGRLLGRFPISATGWRDGVFYFLLFTFYACGVSWCDLGLRDVRVARADVDGDGIAEVVAGGRLGRAPAVDAPRSVRQAGIGVYRVAGNFLHPICERDDLFWVSDVAGGDVDGDGVDEVVAVGLGHVMIFDVVGDQLVEIGHEILENDWTDRVMVADVNGDGRVDVGVTVYHIDPGAEMGRSEVRYFSWANTRLEKHFEFEIDGHVGDLCGVTNERGEVIVALEVGTGDEGGEIQMWSGRSGRVFWRGDMTNGRVRALSLDAQAAQLVIGGVDGQVWMSHMTSFGLSPARELQHRWGLSGLLLLPQRLLTLSNRMGLQLLRF